MDQEPSSAELSIKLTNWFLRDKKAQKTSGTPQKRVDE
jgi:hypothetical protein